MKWLLTALKTNIYNLIGWETCNGWFKVLLKGIIYLSAINGGEV